MKEQIKEKISGTPKDVEQFFGIPSKTLAQMRWKGTGPKYCKRGRVIYFFKDVEEWLRQSEVKTLDSVKMDFPV